MLDGDSAKKEKRNCCVALKWNILKGWVVQLEIYVLIIFLKSTQNGQHFGAFPMFFVFCFFFVFVFLFVFCNIFDKGWSGPQGNIVFFFLA